MKIRKGFVSNSSSTAFMVTNLTDQVKTIADFARETPWLIDQYREKYGLEDNIYFSQKELVASAEKHNITFDPGEEKVCVFGDEQDTLIGRVYDYMLRGEDVSESAKLMDQVNDEEDPIKAAAIGREWLASLGNPDKQDQFTGVDSLSFKIRFHEWCR